MKRNPWKRLLAKKKASNPTLRNQQYTARKITLTWEDLRDQFKAQGGRCFWLSVQINPDDIFEAWNHLAPSIDRLDLTKPYEKGNIVITTRFANLGRGMLTTQQFSPQATKLRRLFQEHHQTTVSQVRLSTLAASDSQVPPPPYEGLWADGGRLALGEMRMVWDQRPAVAGRRGSPATSSQN